MTKRERIYAKYNGRCAYTGKPLGDKWEIDHAKPITLMENEIFALYIKSEPKWHIMSQEANKEFAKSISTMSREARKAESERIDVIHKHASNEWKSFLRKKANEDMNNLMPCLRIVNHYKRDKDIDAFRIYIATLQERIDKLPKYTLTEKVIPVEKITHYTEISRNRQIRRAAYLKEVAAAFDISPASPFCGTFFFERNYEETVVCKCCDDKVKVAEACICEWCEGHVCPSCFDKEAGICEDCDNEETHLQYKCNSL